jgi:tetratricopeptide (TPR) repeat protein
MSCVNKRGYQALKTLMICCLLIAPSTFADEAEDKAQFNRLYAEFNELYANSEEIDPIIEVAEKVFDLAPKIYGKSSSQYAVTMYNLASLYDEKGGKVKRRAINNDRYEKDAIDLYKRYFKLLERLKTTYNKSHVDQYLQFIETENNHYGYISDIKYTNKLINIAQDLELDAENMAELYYRLGQYRYKSLDMENTEALFQNAFEIIINSHGPTHKIVMFTAQHLGNFYFSEKKYSEAIEKYNILLSNDLENTDENRKNLFNIHLKLAHIYLIQKQYLKSGQEAIRAASYTTYPDNENLLLNQPSPELSIKDIHKKVPGCALVEFNIDTKGNPNSIKIIDYSDEIFIKPSLDVANKYLFAPKLVNGKLVDVLANKMRIEYNHLENNFYEAHNNRLFQIRHYNSDQSCKRR